MKRAVCLLSGGMDSAVAAYLAKKEGYEIYALTIDYGQRHARELASARNLAKELGVREHKLLRINLRAIGGSALTDNIKVPAGKTAREINASSKIPATYVPARNTIMLSIALACAEAIRAEAIYIGANHIDYSGYPDCRPEYFRAFQKLADLATKTGVEGRRIVIRTPLLKMSKADIVKTAAMLKVPLKLTWSCYQGRRKACGICDSCVLRKQGFQKAGLKDPVKYEK
jgi:7-cyano-7-deazaguanine synthase